MLNTSDYLIPLKFFSLIIQTIFSISALITRVNQYFINHKQKIFTKWKKTTNY